MLVRKLFSKTNEYLIENSIVYAEINIHHILDLCGLWKTWILKFAFELQTLFFAEIQSNTLST